MNTTIKPDISQRGEAAAKGARHLCRFKVRSSSELSISESLPEFLALKRHKCRAPMRWRKFSRLASIFADNGMASGSKYVAQTSQSAVSRVSKPASATYFGHAADLEVGDTAGWEACATWASFIRDRAIVKYAG